MPSSSSSASSPREFDIVIFGATGFTGFFIVRELVQSIEQWPDKYGQLRWAVAGRNASKLTEKLQQVELELKHNVAKVPKIIASLQDKESLKSMASRTKLVINCVGPYQMYGRPVVEACVESGTHHLDISGENQYIESSQLEFHKLAQEKGILVLSTCGWDSIPCDLGVDFLKRHFDGRLHSVETFIATEPGEHGYRVNFGTFRSAIYGYAFESRLRAIRKRLYSEVITAKLPRSKIHLSKRIVPFRKREFPGWNLEFPGADRDVVQRTQYYNYEHYDEAPVQVQTYFTLSSLTNLLGILFIASIFGTLSLFSLGRKLLERYPEALTFGMFSRDGPSREQINTTRFRLRLFGQGWRERPEDSNTEPMGPFDQWLAVEVSGRDPGYMATSTCIVQAALTILQDRDLMPSGGVLTPASAFRNTKLVDRLAARDFKIQIIENP